MSSILMVKPMRAKIAKKASLAIVVLWGQEGSKGHVAGGHKASRDPAIGCHESRKPARGHVLRKPASCQLVDVKTTSAQGANRPVWCQEPQSVWSKGAWRQEASKAGSQHGAKEPVGSGCQGAEGASRPVWWYQPWSQQVIGSQKANVGPGSQKASEGPGSQEASWGQGGIRPVPARVQRSQ